MGRLAFFVALIFACLSNTHAQWNIEDSHTTADLRGIDSHGIARLTGYVRLWESNRANSKPNIQIVHETPTTGVVDGDAGFGLVVAPFAMDLAISKAKNVGPATSWTAAKITSSCEKGTPDRS